MVGSRAAWVSCRRATFPPFFLLNWLIGIQSRLECKRLLGPTIQFPAYHAVGVHHFRCNADLHKPASRTGCDFPNQGGNWRHHSFGIPVEGDGFRRHMRSDRYLVAAAISQSQDDAEQCCDEPWPRLTSLPTRHLPPLYFSENSSYGSSRGANAPPASVHPSKSPHFTR